MCGLGPWPLVSSEAPGHSQHAPPDVARAWRPALGSLQALFSLYTHCVQALGTRGPGVTQALEGTGLGRKACPDLRMFLYWKKRGALRVEALPRALAELSWGLWSASPGAPPLTSSRTSGVGAAHSFQEGTCEAWTPGLPGRSPSGQSLWHTHYMCRLPVTSLLSNSMGTRPLLKATAGGGEVLELEDPGGFSQGGQHGPHS